VSNPSTTWNNLPVVSHHDYHLHDPSSPTGCPWELHTYLSLVRLCHHLQEEDGSVQEDEDASCLSGSLEVCKAGVVTLRRVTLQGRGAHRAALLVHQVLAPVGIVGDFCWTTVILACMQPAGNAGMMLDRRVQYRVPTRQACLAYHQRQQGGRCAAPGSRGLRVHRIVPNTASNNVS
jgi:hypothetical protein